MTPPQLPLRWRTSPLSEAALGLVEALQKRGFLAYFVGGCVRDELLGRTAKDIDIATNASVDEIQQLFPKNVAVGKQFGVIVVPTGEVSFEIATFRQDGTYRDGRHPDSVTPSTPEEDAKRRDFTINGLFWDTKSHQVIDFIGGLSDLDKKKIVAIGDPFKRFEEDKLRVLRALRFATEFDFSIETKTGEAIRACMPQIHQVSKERIRDELIKMFTGRSPKQAMEHLSEYGFLKEVLPYFEAMKGCEQPPEYHPEGDVWVHVMLMLSHCSYAPLELVLGILFHDIAKPVTFERAADRIRFHHHQNIGAEMTEKILTELKFPTKVVDLVTSMTAQHMRFGDVHKMRPGRLKSFVLQEDFDAHMELHRIDCLSSHGMLENYKLCREALESIRQTPALLEPLLSGRDLIEHGLKPGPQFKVILDKIRDAQLEGNISTKEEALDLVTTLCRG